MMNKCQLKPKIWQKVETGITLDWTGGGKPTVNHIKVGAANPSGVHKNMFTISPQQLCKYISTLINK